MTESLQILTAILWDLEKVDYNFLLNFHNLFLLGFKLYVSLILSQIISLGCIIIRMLLDRISPHYENV